MWCPAGLPFRNPETQESQEALNMLHVSLSELSALGPWDVSICTISIYDVIRLLVQVSRCRRIVSLESNKKPSLSTTIGCLKVVVSQSHKLPTTLNHTSGMNWKNTQFLTDLCFSAPIRCIIKQGCKLFDVKLRQIRVSWHSNKNTEYPWH